MWLNSLTEQHRENVFAAMRSIGQQAEAAEREGRKLMPKFGEIGVGGADFDYRLKAVVMEEFLSALRKGETPTEAGATALVAGGKMVHKWNAGESKGRASIAGRFELQRAAPDVTAMVIQVSQAAA